MAIQRIGSGGTVIVRTGQLAGVGPTGPKGAKGDVGPQGLVGPTGPVGPAGEVLEHLMVAVIEPESIPIGDTTLEHGTIAVDDGSWWVNQTDMAFTTDGAYLVNAFVVFDDPGGLGTGARGLTFYEDSSVIARSEVPCNPATDTVVTISMAFVTNPAATYTLVATNGDDENVSITSGRITVNRIGAGPAGPEGPEGPQGDQGIQGPAGPEGAAGSVDDGFAGIDDLGEL